jgi:hypothetical protein
MTTTALAILIELEPPVREGEEFYTGGGFPLVSETASRRHEC